mmetsp:Transcript_21868/g.70412  ORF Transcript_21868/g.70412 Transcript_21868/m.70412 type:complete len:357 (+) Transcript_21868:759-1829(+)
MHRVCRCAQHVRTRICGHQRVAEAAHSLCKTVHMGHFHVILDETQAAEQCSFHEDSRDKLPDASNLVEPIASCLSGLGRDHVGSNTGRQGALRHFLSTRAQPLVNQVAERVQNVRDEDEHGGVEVRHRHVGQHLGHLNQSLQRAHTLISRPCCHNLIVQPVHSLHVLLLRQLQAVLLNFAGRQLFDPLLRAVHLLGLHSVALDVPQQARRDANLAAESKLIQHFGLLSPPRRQKLVLLHRSGSGARRGCRGLFHHRIRLLLGGLGGQHRERIELRCHHGQRVVSHGRWCGCRCARCRSRICACGLRALLLRGGLLCGALVQQRVQICALPSNPDCGTLRLKVALPRCPGDFAGGCP